MGKTLKPEKRMVLMVEKWWCNGATNCQDVLGGVRMKLGTLSNVT